MLNCSNALEVDEIDIFIIKCLILGMNKNDIQAIAESYCRTEKLPSNKYYIIIERKYADISEVYFNNNDFMYTAKDKYSNSITRFDNHMKKFELKYFIYMLFAFFFIAAVYIIFITDCNELNMLCIDKKNKDILLAVKAIIKLLRLL
jgi:hypothetical protein